MNRICHRPVPTPTRFLIGTAAVTAILSPWLWPYFRHAMGSDLYSHVLLIPVISAYFFREQWATLPVDDPPRPWLGALLALVGGCLLAWMGARQGPADENAFAAAAAALVFWIWAIAAFLFGPRSLRALAFPLVFLVLIIPFPSALLTLVESLLQQGSATAAAAMFRLAGTSLFREDLVFTLPGIRLEVAPECSGIRSSLVLFIVSLVAGRLFLRSPWHRAALAAFVIPLALIRNGFRVFVIGELCVNYGAEMIHSIIHRRGGPLFFALSLIPFVAFLWLLVRRERRVPPLAS